MIFSNVSVRRITAITAMIVVAIFVIFYLGFKYFWTYDKQIKQAQLLQQGEIVRVETIIDLSKLRLGDAMIDYAAWNDMAEFVRNPTEQFVEDSIGIHAFLSHDIHGFYIFSPDKKLVWGKALNDERTALVDDERYKQFFPKILNESEQLDINAIEAVARFIVIENKTYIAATTRICNSEGSGCDKGYIIFLKKLSLMFADRVEKATGIKVDIINNENDQLSLPPIENISYVSKLDYLGKPSVILKIYHHVKLPSFIVLEEVYALLAFSVMFYFINLFAVQSLVQPIRNANLVLEKFQAHGGMIPDESSFVSKEMKKFARTINKIMTELEASREDLRWQSEHDPLTQISNRRHLETRLTAFIDDYQFSFIALYLVDIDYFKLYNDNFSHPEGDKALKAVATALNNINYRGDKIVARFGGEEFCVVLASDEPIDVNAYGQVIKDTIAELEIPHPYSQLEDHKYLSISIGGIQVVQPSIENYQDFFHQADQALYAAKKRGRNQYVVQEYEVKTNDLLV